MTDISSTPANLVGQDGRSTLPSILKSPVHATVDDDLEMAMPRPSRAVSFSEHTKRSISPPASQPSLYDLVRPPTPIPQDTRSQQQQQQRQRQRQTPRSVRAWHRLGVATILIIESIALGVVVFAACHNLGWTCRSPSLILPVVFLGTHACARSLAFIIRALQLAAWGPESVHVQTAWEDTMDVVVPLLAVVLATVVFYAMEAKESCAWTL